jgi:hypothetical protein
MKKRTLYKYSNGGTIPPKRKPITVTDPNDPRLNAYKDSSDLYNYTILQKQLEHQSDFIPTNISELLTTGKSVKLTEEGNINKMILTAKGRSLLKNNPRLQKGLVGHPVPTDDMYGEEGSFDIQHPTIKPKGTWRGTALNNDYSNVKPVQPVIYQKPVVKQPEFKKQKGDIILTSTSDPRINDPSYYAVADGVLRKKPVKPVAVQPKPQPQQQIIDTPIQVTIAQPPAYTSQKQMYQGRAFMDSTKLRPGLYHPEEIEERMKNPNKKFPDGGKIYNPNNANSDLNFLNWYKNNTIEGKRGVPYSNELDYDYFSFYKNKSVGNINNHFPDTYKLPNHETFSNESLYAGNGAKGYWDKNKFIKYQDGGQIMKERTLPEYKKGGMIKRADGSYSKRGLWDNIRENKGSGKKPTKEMLKQERKIKAKMEEGGVIDNPGFNALPKEVQENIIANMAMGGYIYSDGGTIKRSLNKYNNGGYTLSSTQGQLNKFNSSGGQSSVVGGQTDAGSGSSGSMNMAGAVQLGSMAGNALLGLIPDKTMTDSEGNVLGSYETKGEAIGKGALSGAAAGAQFGLIGAGVGALVGGTMGFVNQRKDEKDLKEVQSAANQKIVGRKITGGPNSQVPVLSTNNNNMYPYGGTINDDQFGAIAELELQEQMQLPDGTVMGVDGPSHKQGGIEVNVPEGTRVFSDRLKNGKRTFAQDAKSINSKIAKLDKKPNSQAKTNTEMLFNQQLDNLFNTQEEMKIVKEQNKQRKLFAKGGTIPPSHNGMYPAHNVTLMQDGGITPQQGGYTAQVLSSILQNQQINKIAPPRTIKDVAFSAGRGPSYVDYSGERAAIDAETVGARRGVNLGSGSYSTQAANLQKIRNQQMMNKGRSLQTERNANAQLDNAYAGAQAAAYNQGVQANLGIDQYNLENLYNYNLWKAGNRMKIIGSSGDNMTNMFNNQIAKNNQMAYWDVMKNMYSGNVGRDIGMPGSNFTSNSNSNSDSNSNYEPKLKYNFNNSNSPATLSPSTQSSIDKLNRYVIPFNTYTYPYMNGGTVKKRSLKK